MMTVSAGPGSGDQVTAQSLAAGAAGIALLNVERALNGSGDWVTAAHAIRAATAGDIDAGDRAGLYYGVPAIRFVLAAAQADDQARYRKSAQSLDRHVTELAHRKLTTAAERRRHTGAVAFRDYDLFYGLTGLAALLLRTGPGSDILGRILVYLAGLARPRRDREGMALPGWWVTHDPDPTLPTPGGHANLGMAHGVSGILALLALATLRGIEVPGQLEAIEQLSAFFGSWRQDDPGGPWWPQWITRPDLCAGRTVGGGQAGTRGVMARPASSRALQLAGLATGDLARQRQAEHDLADSLTVTHIRRSASQACATASPGSTRPRGGPRTTRQRPR